MILLMMLLSFSAGVIAGISYLNQPWKKFWKYWLWHEHTWVDGCGCGLCEKYKDPELTKYRHCVECNRVEYLERDSKDRNWQGWYKSERCRG